MRDSLKKILGTNNQLGTIGVSLNQVGTYQFPFTDLLVEGPAKYQFRPHLIAERAIVPILTKIGIGLYNLGGERRGKHQSLMEIYNGVVPEVVFAGKNCDGHRAITSGMEDSRFPWPGMTPSS